MVKSGQGLTAKDGGNGGNARSNCQPFDESGKRRGFSRTRAAVLQMTSTPDVEANLASARNLLEQARVQGANLAALPENFALMGLSDADKVKVAETPGEGPIQAFLGHCARELGLWIIGG